MSRLPAPLLPRIQQYLTEVGDHIRLARLRRKLSTTRVAERAAITRPTLRAIESGAPTVSMGAYVQVLAVLGLEQNLPRLAGDDVLGHKLQDADLLVRERAPKQPRRS
ncbi:MAG: helix-turn-helix domain-containing protein [Bacteroidota bacterium]|nr:helix-turn-helix domain-containing protein [Bacteroidota bacterium]